MMGISNGNLGVSGESQLFPGVRGHSVNGRGTEGFSDTLEGVVGISKQTTGVLGISEASGAGVIGQSASGIGVHGKGGRLAGFFEGDVEVTGDIRLANADCAEDFDVSGVDKVEPGTVMVLGSEGGLSESQCAYDKRVAGVISGAGNYKPGIVLDQKQSPGNRQPVALMGKVFCKVDAQFGAIAVGDLLTTSPTPGHAMKTSDPFKAFGAVIGKALRPWISGKGLIPILIACSRARNRKSHSRVSMNIVIDEIGPGITSLEYVRSQLKMDRPVSREGPACQGTGSRSSLTSPW